MKRIFQYTGNYKFRQKGTEKKKKSQIQTMYTKIQKLQMSDLAMQAQNTKRVLSVRLKYPSYSYTQELLAQQ